MKGPGLIAVAASALGAALTLVAGAGAARADGPPTPWLQGETADVTLSTDAQSPDGRAAQLGGALSYVLRPAEGVTTRLDLDAKAGDSPAGLVWPGAAPDVGRQWRDLGVGFKADWAAPSGADLSLGLTNRVSTYPVSAVALGGEADAPWDQRSEQGAALAASLKPAAALALTLGAQVRAASDALDLPSDRALLRTRDGEVNAGLAWTLSPRLKLSAGGRLTSADVSWTEGAAAAQSYAAVQPDLAATVTPWSDALLTIDVARAATPLDAGKFVTLARASAAGADAADLRPDQEWRVQARWVQALPRKARLELGMTRAELESTTEMVRVGADVEAPGSVAGGRRSQFDVALDAPLDLLGLHAVSLQSRGVWRRSEITDPLTGADRRISGEAPYETSVALVHALPLAGVTWGVNTRDQGDQSFYGLNQLSQVETSRSLGAFIEYKPSNFALRLQLDDLAGGDRRWTDAFYVDGRDLGVVGRTDRREEGGPGFTFSLRRVL